jgi:iron(III) transport system substrate-binding protein
MKLGCWLLIIVAALTVGAMNAPRAMAQGKRLVIYSSNESTLNDLVFTTFQKETSIKAQRIQTGSGVIMRRIAAESRHPQSDVVWALSRLNLNQTKNYFAPCVPANANAIAAEFRDPVWKGNIVVSDPSNSGTSYVNLMFLSTLWGQPKDVRSDKLKQPLGNISIVNQASVVFSDVGLGDYPLATALEYAGFFCGRMTVRRSALSNRPMKPWQ